MAFLYSECPYLNVYENLTNASEIFVFCRFKEKIPVLGTSRRRDATFTLRHECIHASSRTNALRSAKNKTLNYFVV